MYFAFHFRVENKQTKKKEPVDESKLKQITLKELAQHTSEDDCWMAIKGRVYDVTAFINEHPGGDIILDGAGTDATDLFFDIGHGQSAQDMLDDMLVGKLVK